MVTPIFLNKYVTKGVFGPGIILHRIMYDRKSHNNELLKFVLLLIKLDPLEHIMIPPLCSVEEGWKPRNFMNP